MAKITINQTTVEWDTEKGICTFNGIPAVSMWVNSTYHHIMSSIVDMVGEERFLLSQQKQGRESINDDWVVISQYPNFAEGVREHSKLAAVGGWGVMSLVELDYANKQAIFQIHDGLEGRSQKEGGVCWGSGIIAGKVAGFCEKLFNCHCWPEQTKFIAKGDACDEFLISESNLTIEQEIDRLVHTDQATRADLTIAFKQLEKESKQRIQAQQALLDSETRLAEAQQIAQMGHWEYDPDNKTTLWSNELYRLLRCDSNAITPSMKYFYKRLHPDDRTRVILDSRNAIKKSQSATHEYRIIQADGTYRFISSKIRTSKKEDGKPARIFGIIQDITDRKKLEEQNREQELQLIQADKMASLGMMVSGVAHEINNPNNLIQINASLLKEIWHDTQPILEKYQLENRNFLMGGLPYQDAIESMPYIISGFSDASKRIEQNINDLKNFARHRDNKNLVDISVNEAIESAVRLLRPLIKSKTNNLQIDLADDLPDIEGNLQHVEQIVVNLLSNALDALPNSKYKVWITSLFDEKTNQIQIQIKDNGIGISKSNLKQIFDPFFSTKQAAEGTGLGLSIAFNLTKEYGGNLSCVSTVGDGAIFTVSFPIK